MKHNKKQLSESLYENDLQWLVSDSLLIDMHKTKLGDDTEYVVVAIPVEDKKPATDLAQFLESSVHNFLDIEVSPGMDKDGRYLVYVEVERNPELYQTISDILTDVSKLSGIREWNFKSMNMRDSIEFNEENFSSHVISSPEEYLRAHPIEDEEQEDNDELVQASSEKESPKGSRSGQTEESVQESIKKRLKFLLDY